MNDKFSTEVVRRVFDDSEGACIEIGPDTDSLNLVQMRTVGKENEEYWGRFSLTFPPKMALQIAKALIAAAEEADLAERAGEKK